MGGKRLKVLFYAINGHGLGHLSRLLAIAREVRALLSATGGGEEICFVTTSEASHIANEFPVYKVPSKNAMATAGPLGRRELAAAAKLVVSNVASSLRPDLLVLDTIPEGAFNEFLFLRDYARKSVFIDRHKARDRSSAPVHQSHLSLYDLVLVPDDAEARDEYPATPKVKARRRFVGRVCGYRPERALGRDAGRAYFGARPEQRLIYVAAGGGGDSRAEEELARLLDALAADERNFLLIGYGPLHTGRKRYGRNIAPLSEPDISRFFPAVDLAVSAAGYNTYEELLAAGVPALFYEQDKGMDQQGRRIERGVVAGWHGRLESFDKSYIQNAVATVIDRRRGAYRKALAKRGGSHGALRAAVELILCHGEEQARHFDRDLLYCAAALRLLWRVEKPRLPARAVSHAAAWIRELWSERTLADFAHAARARIDSNPTATDPGWLRSARELLDWGGELAGHIGQLGWSGEVERRFYRWLRDSQQEEERTRRILGDLLETLLRLYSGAETALLLDYFRLEVRRAEAIAVIKPLLEKLELEKLSLTEVRSLLAANAAQLPRNLSH